MKHLAGLRSLATWFTGLLAFPMLACGPADGNTKPKPPARGWNLETAVSISGTWYPALATDSSGHAHVVFKHAESDELRYATNSEGAWKVVSTGTGCFRNAIAVDGNGGIHVAVVSGALRYATNGTGSWARTVIDEEGIGGLAIGLDSSGKIHIACRSANGEVRYTTNARGSWERTILDVVGRERNSEIGLTVDGQGRVHVAYYDGIYRALKYATNVDGSWAKHVVASVGEFLASRPWIAVEGKKVHIVFADQEGFVLRLATHGVEGTSVMVSVHVGQKAGFQQRSVKVEEVPGGPVIGRWVTRDLDGVGNTHCSMAPDGSGNLHVAFIRGGALFHGILSKDTWETGVVDPSVGAGHNSIAVDRSGTVHISYSGGDSSTLKYARSK